MSEPCDHDQRAVAGAEDETEEEPAATRMQIPRSRVHENRRGDVVESHLERWNGDAASDHTVWRRHGQCKRRGAKRPDAAGVVGRTSW